MKLHKPIKVLILGAIVFGLNFIAGCRSAVMEDTGFIYEVPEGKAVVNFVRPSIGFGDGLVFPLWDGETFIGKHEAGTIIQYATTPGEHLFLAEAENWSYAKATLAEGKHYYIKSNPFPGIIYGRVALGGTNANTEPRIYEWKKELQPRRAIPAKAQNYRIKKIARVREAIEDFNNGNVKRFTTLKMEDGIED